LLAIVNESTLHSFNTVYMAYEHALVVLLIVITGDCSFYHLGKPVVTFTSCGVHGIISVLVHFGAY
jgi:hypothetical protein